MEGGRRRIRPVYLTRAEQRMFQDNDTVTHQEIRANQQIDNEIEICRRDKIQLLGTIRELDEEINHAKENERGLKIRIEELEKQCDELKDSGSRWDKALTDRGNELRETRRQLTFCQELIQLKEACLKEYEADLSEKRTKISGLELEKSDLELEKSHMEEEINQQMNRHFRMKEEHKDVNERQEDTIQKLMDETKRLEGQVNVLYGEKTRRDEHVETLKYDKKRLKENAKTLEDDNRKLEERFKEVNDGRKILEGTINTLSDDKTKLEENVKTLEDDKKQLEENVKTLDIDNKRLDENVKTLEDYIKNLEETITTLADDKTKLGENVITFDADKKKLEENVKTIEDDKKQYLSLLDLEVFKRPLCLISVGANNKLRIVEDTIKQIANIDLPCVVIAIAGLYRTGKSFLMNCLAGEIKGFALGDSIESKTKGICVWCRVHPEKKNTVLVLLDTEGLGDVDKGDPTHDNTIFTLASLLCSTLVFNIKGTLDQDVLNKIAFVSELSKNISLGKRHGDDTTAMQFILPDFVLVLRDIALKLVKGTRKITADEYLEESLQDVDYGKSSNNLKYNRARESIRNYFPKSTRKCFLLSAPGDWDTIANLETLKFQDLSRRFQEEITNLVSYINAQPPKQLVVSKPVTGSMFVDLTRTYVEAISKGGVADVEHAFMTVAKSENVKVTKRTLDMFKDLMSQCSTPVPIKVLEKQFRKAEQESLAYFRNNAMFDDGNLEEKGANLQMAIDVYWGSLKEKNIGLIQETCSGFLESSSWIIQFRNSLAKREFEVAGGYALFKKILQMVEIEFKNTFDGYESHEFMGSWYEFLQNLQPQEIDILAKDHYLTAEERK